METLLKALVMVPPLLVAVILHEMAHGYVAERLGDPTARQLGRITFNPIKHIDPFLTILLPAMLILAGSPVIFGGAKPVPVNPMFFPNPRKGMMLVAVAGPLTNFTIAAACYAVVQTPGLAEGLAPLPFGAGVVVYLWLLHSILINLVLGIFNLVPIPPLDGGRIAVGLLPLSLARPLARIEPFGILIVFLLLYSGLLNVLLAPIVNFALQGLS